MESALGETRRPASEIRRPALVERSRLEAPISYYTAGVTILMAASALELMSKGTAPTPRYKAAIESFSTRYDAGNFGTEEGLPFVRYGDEETFSNEDLLGLASLNFDVPLGFEPSTDPNTPNSYDVVESINDRVTSVLQDPSTASSNELLSLSEQVGILGDIDKANRLARREILETIRVDRQEQF